MADYLPVFAEGRAITLTASAAITGGQLVAVSGSGTVAPAGDATAGWVGFAAFDALVGDPVTIHATGVQAPVAAGAVAAGDRVVSASGGRVATSTSPAVAALVGVALTSAASGSRVRVAVAR